MTKKANRFEDWITAEKAATLPGPTHLNNDIWSK